MGSLHFLAHAKLHEPHRGMIPDAEIHPVHSWLNLMLQLWWSYSLSYEVSRISARRGTAPFLMSKPESPPEWCHHYLESVRACVRLQPDSTLSVLGQQPSWQLRSLISEKGKSVAGRLAHDVAFRCMQTGGPVGCNEVGSGSGLQNGIMTMSPWTSWRDSTLPLWSQKAFQPSLLGEGGCQKWQAITRPKWALDRTREETT